MASDIYTPDTKLTVKQFWNEIVSGSKTNWTQVTEFMLHQFGTALSCNRFAVGEVIENATGDFLRACGIKAECVPSAKRIDIDVKNVEGLCGLSSKFVSTGNHVILHNAQRTTNTDFTVSPTLLFLTNEWWFLYPPLIAELGIDIKTHFKDTGDSLQLKFTILEELRKKNYPYCMKFSINYNKSEALMKSVSDMTYAFVKDLHNPDTPPTIREYLQKTLDNIPSRRIVVPVKPKKPSVPRKKKTNTTTTLAPTTLIEHVPHT
jgi:hypothetical protein